MTDNYLVETANEHLQKLCADIPNRCVGSPGNHQATDYFAEKLKAFGFQVDSPQFNCIDWSHGEVQLMVGGEKFSAQVSPYSLGCEVTAPLAVATSVDELENTDQYGGWWDLAQTRGQ